MATIDLHALNKMIGDDQELLADVAIMFARSLPEMKARLRFGIENREASDIENASHQLRSHLSYFGANGLKLVASQIESAARRKELTSIPELNQQLFEGIDQLLNELRTLTNLSLEVESE